MRRLSFLLGLLLLLTACESTENFWNPERCKSAMDTTLRHFDEYYVKIEDAQKRYEDFERSGDAAAAQNYRKSIESFRENGIGSGLTYIDTDLANCDQTLWTPEQKQRIENARDYLKTDMKTVATEETPGLAITGIDSRFIPYESNESGSCSGPYIEITFTVVNRGGDFPRPVDFETMKARTQDPIETMLYFTIVYDMDYGTTQKPYNHLQVLRSDFVGGTFMSGQTFRVTKKLLVENNQKNAHVKASIVGGGFLNVGQGTEYEGDIDIPVWDVYTSNHKLIKDKNEKGEPVIKMKADITNLGKSTTPGPVNGNFTIKQASTDKSMTSWHGDTAAPLGPGETGFILGERPMPAGWTDDIKVDSLVYAQCPEGMSGSVSDGDATNNMRILVR